MLPCLKESSKVIRPPAIESEEAEDPHQGFDPIQALESYTP